MGILINSMFLDTLHWRYLWFFLGLCCAVLKKAKTEKVRFNGEMDLWKLELGFFPLFL